MRIMALNHTFVRDIDAELERRRLESLRSYASPGTIIEGDYPEDLGGSEVLHHLRKTKTLSGLHHSLGTPALVKKILEAERGGFHAVVQIEGFYPGGDARARCRRGAGPGAARDASHPGSSFARRSRTGSWHPGRQHASRGNPLCGAYGKQQDRS